MPSGGAKRPLFFSVFKPTYLSQGPRHRTIFAVVSSSFAVDAAADYVGGGSPLSRSAAVAVLIVVVFESVAQGVPILQKDDLLRPA